MIEATDFGRCLTARATHERSRALRCVSALRVSVAIAWGTLCEFIQSWSAPEIEPEPRRLPAEALPAQDHLKSLERVECKCRQYHGTDFWNDPHRWCGVDANHEVFWMKAEPRSCERTFRPKPKPVVAVVSYDTTLSLGGGGGMMPYSPMQLSQMQMLQQMQQAMAQQNTLGAYAGNQLNSYFSAQGNIYQGY